MKKKYTGKCHCGAVTYQVEFDLAAGTFKCNCEICTKKRMWAAIVSPADFRLESGESELVDYRPYDIHHLFCRNCGIHAFAWGENPGLGGKFYGVSIASLEDVNIEELVNAPIAYFDGRNDNYQSPPTETRHL